MTDEPRPPVPEPSEAPEPREQRDARSEQPSPAAEWTSTAPHAHAEPEMFPDRSPRGWLARVRAAGTRAARSVVEAANPWQTPGADEPAGSPPTPPWAAPGAPDRNAPGTVLPPRRLDAGPDLPTFTRPTPPPMPPFSEPLREAAWPAPTPAAEAPFETHPHEPATPEAEVTSSQPEDEPTILELSPPPPLPPAPPVPDPEPAPSPLSDDTPQLELFSPAPEPEASEPESPAPEASAEPPAAEPALIAPPFAEDMPTPTEPDVPEMPTPAPTTPLATPAAAPVALAPETSTPDEAADGDTVEADAAAVPEPTRERAAIGAGVSAGIGAVGAVIASYVGRLSWPTHPRYWNGYLALLIGLVTMSMLMFVLAEPSPRWVLLVAAGATIAGLDGVLRATWRLPFEGGMDTVPYLFLPALYVFAAPLLIEHNVSGHAVIGWSLAAGVGFGAIVVTEVLSVRNGSPLYPMARMVITGATYFTAFSLLSMTSALRIGIVPAVLATWFIATMLAIEAVREGEVDPRETVVFAIVAGLLVAQARWLLFFLPLDGYPAGLALVLAFYLVTGVLHAYVIRQLNSVTAASYGLVAAIGVALLLVARAAGLA